ncbi:MAG TPA: Asp-tRNA(Asn)/Glu-tRNA(Gln) amidotransferase subunit GatC [Candidatus Hydrogenedentes bacterium]|nr:Asp-tRNA(Asn)/Glu-tRNA(Gln) amidotransferase subunit GatC [Candidatus Hydrogenedentota bacterium]
MAKITTQDVEYVAALAQLVLDDDSKERLVHEMGDILEYMDKLDELDTEGIEPMMHVLDLANVYREDVVRESLSRETAMRNAPKTDGEFFLVPRILDTE